MFESNRNVSGEDTVTSVSKDAAYLLALEEINGVGPKLILELIKNFPNPDVLRATPGHEVAKRFGARISKKLAARIPIELSSVWSNAEQTLQNHIQKNVFPIPITDKQYPCLLRLIPDPPPILFAKGKIPILSETKVVAVVGTRKPTSLGIDITHQVAFRLASNEYTVVSGLAKGIDTAAHLSALEARGKTVAVLGTPLDKIYPPENESLARCIEKSGVLVSELAFGAPASKAAFVRRDRIQSGLAIAVFAIQTDLTGGTMHTIRFAKRHDRLLFCPEPPEAESTFRQNSGILRLIRSGRALKVGTDYNSVFNILNEHHEHLTSLARKFAIAFTRHTNQKESFRDQQLERFITQGRTAQTSEKV
jgi:DNA processing protein